MIGHLALPDGTDPRPAVLLGHEGIGPNDFQRRRADHLVCVGSEDPLAPPEQRLAFEAEMRAAALDWRLIVYGGAEHAFHHPPVDADGSLSGPDTHREAVPGVGCHHAHAVRAWRDVLQALDEAFGESA